MNIYIDQNIWQYLYQNYPAQSFKKEVVASNIKILFGAENIYEFGRLFLSQNEEKIIKNIFSYLCELVDIFKYIKEPNLLVLDDIQYARTGAKNPPYLNSFDIVSTKREIYKISQGCYKRGKNFVGDREEKIKKDSPDFSAKVKSINVPLKEKIKYKDFKNSWEIRRKMLNNSKYKEATKHLSNILLFNKPEKYPHLNTWINAQLYISFIILSQNGKAVNYTSDFRHLLCAASVDTFITNDKKLLTIGKDICPYIEIVNWEDFENEHLTTQPTLPSDG